MATPRKKRNVGNYDAAARFFAKINQDMEDIWRVMNPPYLETFNDLAKVMDQIRLQQVEMSHEWMSSVKDSVAHLTSISKSSQRIHNMFTQTNLAIDSLNQAHESWFEQRKMMSGAISSSAQLEIAAKLSLIDTSVQLAVTETTLAGIDFDSLKSQFDLPFSSISAMEQSLFDTTASYHRLTEFISDLSGLVQMPSFVLPGATYGLYTAGLALKVLDIPDQPEHKETEEDAAVISVEYVDKLDIVELLKIVRPELVTLYLGAKEALYSNNPDRIRHALSSLRELWNNVVREIAPNEQVSEWIAEHGTYDDLDCNNRPTRRGKIKYLSRNIISPPMVDFVDQSATMSTRLHKLYGRVHQLKPGLSDDQLLLILWRTEFELSYLIRIWLTTAQ